MLQPKQTNTHQNVHWAAQLWYQPKYNYTYFQSCYGISEEHNHTDLSVALNRVTYLFFNKMCEFPCGPRDLLSGQSKKCLVLNLSYTGTLELSAVTSEIHQMSSSRPRELLNVPNTTVIYNSQN